MTMTSISNAGSRPVPQATETLFINQSIDSIAAELGGDPEAYLAAMVMKFANEDSKAAREHKAALEEHIAQVQGEEIQDMRDQADEMRTAGLWAAGGGVIGGLCTAGAGVAGFAIEDSGTSALASKVLEGSGKVVEGVGKGGDGIYSQAAKNQEADATAGGNRADAAIRKLDAVEEELDSARELEKDALDFLDKARDTRNQTEQSVFIRG
jgi:hypothetical protein